MYFSHIKDKNKRRAIFRQKMRRPDGLLQPWVFFYVKFWGTRQVISMDAYRQRKYAENNPFKSFLTWPK